MDVPVSVSISLLMGTGLSSVWGSMDSHRKYLCRHTCSFLLDLGLESNSWVTGEHIFISTR